MLILLKKSQKENEKKVFESTYKNEKNTKFGDIEIQKENKSPA